MKSSGTSTDTAVNVARPETDVSAHQPIDGRTVFTEDGNTDGWIATDLTVTPEP